jgi:tRNA threonylcarbamoyladenosine modification (KEOPS) complex  Pcc1 subunit
MKVKCKIWIKCKSEKEAKMLNDAIKIDNERYIESKARGNYIEAEAKANDILSILHTLDDFLACLSLAQQSIEVAERIKRE